MLLQFGTGESVTLTAYIDLQLETMCSTFGLFGMKALASSRLGTQLPEKVYNGDVAAEA